MKNFIKTLIRTTAKNKILFLPMGIFARVVIYVIYAIQSSGSGLLVIGFNNTGRHKVVNLINKIKREVELLMSTNEAYQIFMAVKRTEKVKGDIVEVGVYKGGSAKLICEAKGNKTLYLFDTFKGVPKVDEIDAPYFYKGEFAASFENVKNYLGDYSNVYFYKGLFPVTAKHVKDKKFSFANFDVDTYESTLDCLKFFYQRMNKGGIIMSHDYISIPGVTKAFDEFFKNKPEPIIEMYGSQCLIVKV